MVLYPFRVILYKFSPRFRATKCLGNIFPNSRMWKLIQSKPFPSIIQLVTGRAND